MWREQKDRAKDCYLCLNNVSGFSAKNKKSIEYLPSAMGAAQQDNSLPAPRRQKDDKAGEDATVH